MGYVRAQGGPHVTCKTSRIRNYYVWSDALGRYGEPMGNKTAGVTYENIVVISRIHEWKIFRKDEKPTPWSTVNNYTHQIETEQKLNQFLKNNFKVGNKPNKVLLA